jgi:hypothetical protein
MNPKSLKNLKPLIKKGEVRNRLGVNQKKRPITDEYFRVSQEPMPVNLIARFNRSCHAKLLQPGDTWARAIAIRAHYEAAMHTSIRAMREIRESMEGKAPQRLEITGPERKEITLRVIHDRESAVSRNRRDGYDSTEVSLGIGGLVTCRDPKNIRYVLWKNGLYGMNPTSIT